MDNIICPFQIPIYQSFIEEDSFIQIKKDVNVFIDNNFNLFNNKWDCPTLTTQGVSIERNTIPCPKFLEYLGICYNKRIMYWRNVGKYI